MKIEVNELSSHGTERYPYTHRVKLSGDALASDKVSAWLKQNNIPHTQTGWGVYYLRKYAAEWLMLRWS